MSTPAERMLRIFRGYERAHYSADFTNLRIVAKKRIPQYDVVAGPITIEEIEAHLAGKRGVLAVPVDEHGMSYFGKIDLDDYGANVPALAQRVERRGLPLITELSKSRGAHFSFYPKRPWETPRLRQQLVEWAADLGFTNVEIFPKQDKLDPERDTGAGINLPYFGGDEAENYALNEEGERMTLEQWLDKIEAMPERLKPALGTANVEAAADFLAQFWTEGHRDILNIRVIGTLLRAKLDESLVEQLIEKTRDIAGDLAENRRSVNNIASDLANDTKKIPGFTKLTDPAEGLMSKDEALELMRLMGAKPPPTQTFLLGPEAAIGTREELHGLPYVAPQIVDLYLPEDAGGFVSPGGLGKSSLMLFEAATIRLGRALWGRKVVRPGGGTLIVTAEDRRPVVLGRLNDICGAMGLTVPEREEVRRGVFVEDISRHFVRLVTGAWVSGAILFQPTSLLDEICDRYAEAKLAQIVIDPTSLIGPGEGFGNDGMAPLMQAGRMISERMHCAVRFLHHVGQAVARQGTQDQYTGRGGTAFADNARFLAQLVTVRERDFAWEEVGGTFRVPAEATDGDLAQGRVRAILVHKLSYREPIRIPIFVLRRGWAFTHLASDEGTTQVAADAWMTDGLAELHDWWVKAGRQHFYLNDVEDMKDTIFPRGKLPKTKAKAVVGYGRFRGVILETGQVKPHAKVSSLTFSADFDPHAL